jgi:signal transduction histidine kinase
MGASAQALIVVVTAALSHLSASSLAATRVAAASERRAQELAFMLRASQALSSTLEAREIVERAVRLSAEGVSQGAGRPPHAAFHELDPEGEKLRIVVVSEGTSPGVEGFEYELARNQAALGALRSGRAALVRPDHLGGRLHELARREGWQVLAMATVRAGSEVAGFLAATSRAGPAYDRRQLRLLEVLANLTALALGNAEHLNRERLHVERSEALERAKSDLLNLVSHELRSPLTVLAGYLSMLADGSLGEVGPGLGHQVLPVLRGKVTEMEILVEQMLEASRMEESRLVLAPRRVDLRELAADAVRSATTLAGVDHRIELVQPEEPVPVMVDPGRVGTILSNLLDNGVKYSPEGGEVTCAVAAADGQALVTVADRGLGIREEDLPKLFGRFGRLVTPENSHIAGTGLGLYLSRELARMHGGDITVESSAGKGSRFTLSLPLAAVG